MEIEAIKNKEGIQPEVREILADLQAQLDEANSRIEALEGAGA